MIHGKGEAFMRVRFEQVDSREKEQALIRAVEKTADILNAMDLLENGSGGISVTRDRSTYFCKLTQIYYIESVDKRSFVYTKGGCYETKYRLYELESEKENIEVYLSELNSQLNTVGTDYNAIQQQLAETTLQRVLGTDVEHILLPFTHHPLLTTEHLEHIAAVVELIAPFLVKTTIFSLEEGEVQLTIEALAHVVLHCDVSTIVAGVALVHQRLIHIIE